MTELQRVAVLISLVENLKEKGSWCGETHMQKAIYFLQTLFRVPTDFDYILYKHGPFSFDLRDKLTALRAYDIFGLQIQPPPYGPSLIVKEVGESIKKAYSKSFERFKKEMDFVATVFENKNVAELERLSTALYIIKNEGVGRNKTIIASRINSLKPHVSLDEASSAVDDVLGIINQVKMQECA
ncbi:MAG: hypothetical protein ABIH66_06390 [bacterium]